VDKAESPIAKQAFEKDVTIFITCVWCWLDTGNNVTCRHYIVHIFLSKIVVFVAGQYYPSAFRQHRPCSPSMFSVQRFQGIAAPALPVDFLDTYVGCTRYVIICLMKRLPINL
jgi:hypothetical protein